MTISENSGTVLSMYVHDPHIQPTRRYGFAEVLLLSDSPFPILALVPIMRVPHLGHLGRMTPPFGPFLSMYAREEDRP